MTCKCGDGYTMTEEEVLRAWINSKPSQLQDGAMTYESGDCYITRPTFVLLRFAEELTGKKIVRK